MSRVHILFILFGNFMLACSQLPKENSDNYGPYKLEFENFNICKGPKAQNMTYLTAKQMNNNIIEYNFTFFADTKLDLIKIRVYNVKENKKNFVWNYNLNDPCNHFSFALMLKQYFIVEKSCLIKKGSYSCVVNIEETMLAFAGPSFLYGTFYFKTETLSKKGNIACITNAWTVSKK